MANTQINIKENGTTILATSGCYCDRDIDVIVEVEGNAPAVIEALEILENGIYTAPEGVDGYSPITVNVPSGGGNIEVDPIVLTGNCSYTCAGPIASAYIKLFGNTISTEGVYDMSSMFMNYSNPTVPFEINCRSNFDTSASAAFQNSKKLEQLPKINNLKPVNMQSMFLGCFNLAYIPEDYFDNWDFGSIESQTSGYAGNMSYLFQSCHSLRKIPKEILRHGNKNAVASYNVFYQLANNCYSLDELTDTPFIYVGVNKDQNLFYDTFKYSGRLKDFTFEMPNGSPIVANLKAQSINLSSECGWFATSSNISSILNSPTNGITDKDYVKDDTTYQALKDTDNWYTSNHKYSRYNRISAINTINSLPDTSAYLASAGGTNTIIFKGEAGSLTDGGAINTLTEEEIAVATAKGWTVSLV